MIIDATSGSIARFVNHSCKPNCHMIKWIVAGQPRVALFAGPEPIQTGDELTYDYNFDPFSLKNVQKCLCGEDNCRGVLGPRPKEKPAAAIAAAAAANVAGGSNKGKTHGKVKGKGDGKITGKGDGKSKAKGKVPVKVLVQAQAAPVIKRPLGRPPSQATVARRQAIEALLVSGREMTTARKQKRHAQEDKDDGGKSGSLATGDNEDRRESKKRRLDAGPTAAAAGKESPARTTRSITTSKSPVEIDAGKPAGSDTPTAPDVQKPPRAAWKAKTKTAGTAVASGGVEVASRAERASRRTAA